MRQLVNKMLLGLCVITLSGCHSDDKNTLKVGTISGPETELMQTAQTEAKKMGLNIKIIEFSDYLQPNAALSDGNIDANMFQHQPFLDQQIKDKHYQLVAIGKTFVYPMGLYSTKITAISQLPNKAIIGIPNDPSNEGRALLLLQKAKLIQLKKSASVYATPIDIIANPKHLVFKELDAAQLARSLPDVDIAAINTNYAILAGLSPSKNALFIEDKHSPYANIIVIRKDELNDPRMQQLVTAFQSAAVLNTAQEVFKGEAIPAW